MNLFKKLTHWYLSRSALPYWCVLFMDLAIGYFSGLLVFWFYYRGAIMLGNIIPLSKTIGIYLLFSLIGFRIFHTYSGIVRYSSIEDLRHITYAQGVSLVFALGFHYLVIFKYLHFLPLVGRQILLMYVLATVFMWSWRIIVKEVYDELIGQNNTRHVLIYGVHAGATALARSIRSGGSRRFRLMGFISPDPNIANKIVVGKRVYSNDKELDDLIRDRHIEAVIVSPMAMRQFRNDTALQDRLLNLGVQIYVMRNMEEWHEGEEINSDTLKDVDVSDLLPRDEIHVDMDAIGKMLNGRTILITGSAGSIGSEMVRQIAKYKPSNMILVDQAETPQHDILLMMKKQFPDINNEVIVASICQRSLMERIFAQYHPDYVFHAAAYKHVPMMETEPSEAILNNVRGTKYLADLSVEYGVKKFVMISTDKAVNPTNIMGCSKRLCEIYTQSLNAVQSTTEFVTTRFGNVLGSNGSVIPIFAKQIREGGPVTVTDPNITRFFMLIPEACELVLEAGTHGHGGQIFVFDMGQPVRIADLAKRMIKLSGATHVQIVYTGLRAGEKLYEEVLADQESTEPTFNNKIRIAKVRQYEFDEVSKAIDNLITAAGSYDARAVVAQMKAIVPEYKPANTKW
jgi:FlaA1/EpsC-like NDP-sugar epimerase